MKSKRIVSMLVGTALVCALALGIVACDNVKSLVPKQSSVAINYTVNEVNGLANYDVLLGSPDCDDIDSFGMMVVTKTTNTDTEYVLFDVVNNKPALSKANGTAIQRVTSGLYCAMTPGDPSQEGSKDAYVFYDRTGKEVYTSDELPTVAAGGATFSDGTSLQVKQDGTVAVVKRSLQPSGPSFMSIYSGGYYWEPVTNSVNVVGFDVFEEDGTYVRTIDFSSLPVADNMDLNEQWIFDRYYYMQFSCTLPEEAKEYDYFYMENYGMQKFALVTYRIDAKTGKAKQLDGFDFYISDTYGTYSSDCMILRGYPVIGYSLQTDEVLQTFDKNGKVYVDLQEILPGCDEFNWDQPADTILLENDLFTVLYDGKSGKELTRFRNGTAEYIYGGWIKQEDGDAYILYDREGNETMYLANESGEKTYFGCSDSGTLYYTVTPAATAETPDPATTLYAYSADEGERVVGTFAEIISQSGLYRLVGTDGKESAFDLSTETYVYEGLENVSALSQSNASSYRFEKGNMTIHSYLLLQVTITDEEGTSYRYFLMHLSATTDAAMVSLF